MKKQTAWSAMAETAEERNDWHEAKRCWYYAAQDLRGNPHGLRTYYGLREDRCASMLRLQNPDGPQCA